MGCDRWKEKRRGAQLVTRPQRLLPFRPEFFFFSASLSFFLSFFRLFDNALKWDEKKKKRENDQEIYRNSKKFPTLFIVDISWKWDAALSIRSRAAGRSAFGMTKFNREICIKFPRFNGEEEVGRRKRRLGGGE